MNTIKFKIHDYDEASHSLIISFASDSTSSTNPDDYRRYAYQPITMWPDAKDRETLLNKIAAAGIFEVQQVEEKEKIVEDGAVVELLKSVVGTEATYNVADLLTPAVQENDPMNPETPIMVA